MILDEAKANGRPCNIVVTQPRRIAARSIAEQVCRERNWQLGQLVGYQVRTILLYSTIWLILKMYIASYSICSVTGTIRVKGKASYN